MTTAMVAESLEFTIGDRMAKAREHAGLTQTEMALRLGVKPATISAWERGANQPRDLLAIVQKWADICGVDSAWILTGGTQKLKILTAAPYPDDLAEQLTLHFDPPPRLSLV